MKNSRLSTTARGSSALLVAALLALSASPSRAAPLLTSSPAAFAGSSTSFGFGGGMAGYTLSSTGDIFNPVAISTTGTAQVNSFGGFLGIPLQPTTNFIDRGTVVFSTSASYAAYPTPTTIPYSNGDNFVGLEFSLSDGVHVGFVQFEDTNLIGYGYETTPGAAITAVDIRTVPEPATAVLVGTLLAGMILLSRAVKSGRI